MADVFGGFSTGSDDQGPAALTTDEVSLLEAVIEGAVVLGAELDARYRVLAVTLEPRPERYVWGPSQDRRVQILASPVSTFLVALRRTTDDGRRELLTFEQDQLPDLLAAMDGPRLHGPVFGRPEPRPGEWAPRFSLEGRSSAPDGTAATLRLELDTDGLEFGLFARFDEVEVRDASRVALRLP